MSASLDPPRGKIASDLPSLTALAAVHAWIPSASQIRPAPETLQAKQKLRQEIDRKWSSTRDWLLHEIFDLPFESNYVGQLYVVDDQFVASRESRFIPNAFPYQASDPQAQHWVLWYPDKQRPSLLTDDVINTHLQQHLERVAGSSFVFAWYENPKMQIPDLYHVQCFWRMN